MEKRQKSNKKRSRERIGRGLLLAMIITCARVSEIESRPSVGETGYGCHTFYITDVFRNNHSGYQTLAMFKYSILRTY